jgi:hypothetical protein
MRSPAGVHRPRRRTCSGRASALEGRPLDDGALERLVDLGTDSE